MWQGLAEEFAKRGHDVLIMPRRYPGQLNGEIRDGVRYVRRGGFAQSQSIGVDLAKDFIYASNLVAHLPAADILVANDFWLPVLAGMFRSRAGKMIISANRFPKSQYGLYRRAARIVAASRVIEQAIALQTPTIAQRVRCIPNPFDTKVFVPPVSGRKGRSHRTVLFVGRIHPEKAVHFLVGAFGRISSKYPDTRLHIVGPSRPSQGGGGEGYLLELRTLAANQPVTFSEPEFDVRKLALLYQEADLFCYPSVAEMGEALPVAPLEAMSTGLPIIVSGLECFSDILTAGETGLIFDHRQTDPIAALAMKLDDALADWSQTLEIGHRACDAAQQFSFPRVADQFLAEFAAVMAGT